jgi:hypothetical protein
VEVGVVRRLLRVRLTRVGWEFKSKSCLDRWQEAILLVLKRSMFNFTAVGVDEVTLDRLTKPFRIFGVLSHFLHHCEIERGLIRPLAFGHFKWVLLDLALVVPRLISTYLVFGIEHQVLTHGQLF